jgi:hypothetical protein
MSSIALARAYRQSFEAHPHCTLAIAGGALTALGDAVAQLSQYIVRLIFESHPLMLNFFSKTISSNDGKAGFHYDIPRTLRFFCFGAGISTCFHSAKQYYFLTRGRPRHWPLVQVSRAEVSAAYTRRESD